jgi:hypothetical protein
VIPGSKTYERIAHLASRLLVEGNLRCGKERLWGTLRAKPGRISSPAGRISCGRCQTRGGEYPVDRNGSSRRAAPPPDLVQNRKIVIEKGGSEEGSKGARGGRGLPAGLPPGEARPSPRGARSPGRRRDSGPWRLNAGPWRRDARLWRQTFPARGGRLSPGGEGSPSAGRSLASGSEPRPGKAGPSPLEARESPPGADGSFGPAAAWPSPESGSPRRAAPAEPCCSLTTDGPFPAGLAPRVGGSADARARKGGGAGAAFFPAPFPAGGVVRGRVSARDRAAPPRWQESAPCDARVIPRTPAPPGARTPHRDPVRICGRSPAGDARAPRDRESPGPGSPGGGALPVTPFSPVPRVPS